VHHCRCNVSEYSTSLTCYAICYPLHRYCNATYNILRVLCSQDKLLAANAVELLGLDRSKYDPCDKPQELCKSECQHGEELPMAKQPKLETWHH